MATYAARPAASTCGSSSGCGSPRRDRHQRMRKRQTWRSPTSRAIPGEVRAYDKHIERRQRPRRGLVKRSAVCNRPRREPDTPDSNDDSNVDSQPLPLTHHSIQPRLDLITRTGRPLRLADGRPASTTPGVLPMRQAQYSRKIQQRPLPAASGHDRQHTELAGMTAKRPAAPLVRDEEAAGPLTGH
jgi:hypothetical protein